MALTRTLLGTNEDGTPHYLYDASDTDHVVCTGPSSAGIVQLGDGALYDVTPHFIEVESAEHAAEVAHHIAVQLRESGRFETLVHECDYCADPKSSSSAKRGSK